MKKLEKVLEALVVDKNAWNALQEVRRKLTDVASYVVGIKVMNDPAARVLAKKIEAALDEIRSEIFDLPYPQGK